MKQTRLLPFVLALLLILAPLTAGAQVGPGGVGSMTNTQLWLRSDSLIAIQPLFLSQAGTIFPVICVISELLLQDRQFPLLRSDVINGYPAVTFHRPGWVRR